jgi:serine/threonine-protein kinase
VPLVATVDAHDEPGALRIHTSRYEVQVPPGASTSFQMDVRAKRRIIVGAPVEHRLSVVVTPHGGTPLRADTAFRQKAYLPRWAPKAAVIGLVVTGLALALPAKRWFETRPRPVPGVVGRTEADAREQLREAGFKVEVKPAFDAVPEGQIARQEPAPGRDLSGGGTVSLILSKGLQPVKVPKLPEGATLSLATRLIEQAGLGVRPEREDNEEVPRDQVLRVEPKEQAEVKPGEVITVTVSNGPKQVAVPTLTSLSRADVITTLTAKGFDVEFREIDRPGIPPDRVYAQAPVPGDRVASGQKITVFITPPPPPTTAPPPIVLPPTPPGTGSP